MKTFLIQTVDNQIVHDFSFALIEAIKYNNWYYNEEIYKGIVGDEVACPIRNWEHQEDFIPIGTVEYVLAYLKKYYQIDNIKPLNIPKELLKPEYLQRQVYFSNNDQPTFNTGDMPIFVKDNIKIKGYTNIVEPNKCYPSGEYMVSEYIDIDSEWRAFVFNNELVGLHNYSGDFTIFPDVKFIKMMIKDFNYNVAYTLDIGVNLKGTFIIECHDFFSCGLYGFADYKLLPKMFISTWNKLIKDK